MRDVVPLGALDPWLATDDGAGLECLCAAGYWDSRQYRRMVWVLGVVGPADLRKCGVLFRPNGVSLSSGSGTSEERFRQL